MKRVTTLVSAALILLIGCDADTSGPEPFSMADLVGTWSGEATNQQNTFTITLTCDATGDVDGSGAGGALSIGATWSINAEGAVTGSGVIGIVSGGSLIIEMGGWSLQMNDDRNRLTGTFSSSHLGTMDVTLDKS